MVLKFKHGEGLDEEELYNIKDDLTVLKQAHDAIRRKEEKHHPHKAETTKRNNALGRLNNLVDQWLARPPPNKYTEPYTTIANVPLKQDPAARLALRRLWFHLQSRHNPVLVDDMTEWTKKSMQLGEELGVLLAETASGGLDETPIWRPKNPGKPELEDVDMDEKFSPSPPPPDFYEVADDAASEEAYEEQQSALLRDSGWVVYEDLTGGGAQAGAIIEDIIAGRKDDNDSHLRPKITNQDARDKISKLPQDASIESKLESSQEANQPRDVDMDEKFSPSPPPPDFYEVADDAASEEAYEEQQSALLRDSNWDVYEDLTGGGAQAGAIIEDIIAGRKDDNDSHLRPKLTNQDARDKISKLPQDASIESKLESSQEGCSEPASRETEKTTQELQESIDHGYEAAQDYLEEEGTTVLGDDMIHDPDRWRLTGTLYGWSLESLE